MCFGLHTMVSCNMQRIVSAYRNSCAALDGCSCIQYKISLLKTFFWAVDMIHGSTEIEIIIPVGRSIINETGIQIKITKIYLPGRKTLRGYTGKSKRR